MNNDKNTPEGCFAKYLAAASPDVRNAYIKFIADNSGSNVHDIGCPGVRDGACLCRTASRPSLLQQGGEQTAKLPFRCFHCDEVFNDKESAALHFGTRLSHDPACQIDTVKYREMERRMEAYNEEDADIHRQMAGLKSTHATDLRREEEKGYARGLRDAANYSNEFAAGSPQGNEAKSKAAMQKLGQERRAAYENPESNRKERDRLYREIEDIEKCFGLFPAAAVIGGQAKPTLPDDFSDSKAWRESDYAGRVEWLMETVRSYRDEIERLTEGVEAKAVAIVRDSSRGIWAEIFESHENQLKADDLLYAAPAVQALPVIAEKDAHLIKTIREAAVDAAHEWQQMAFLGTTRCSCSLHIGDAIDAAIAREKNHG